MNDELRIGDPAEWRRFAETHSGLVDELPHIVTLANKIFGRGWEGNSRDDLLVFSVGKMTFEDFEDILSLVANGRGFGAQKILRPMFEHIVTATYLHKHPDQAQRFLDFEHIRNYKATLEVEKVAPGQIAADRLAQAKADRDRVRGSFKRRFTCHKKCEHLVDAFSWTELGLPDLALAAGDNLRDDLLVSYLMPMTETHPTFTAIAGRQTHTETGTSDHEWDSNSRHAGDRALAIAYKYALQVFQLQLQHFQELKSLQSELDERIAAYNAIVEQWNAAGGL